MSRVGLRIRTNWSSSSAESRVSGRRQRPPCRPVGDASVGRRRRRGHGAAQPRRVLCGRHSLPCSARKPSMRGFAVLARSLLLSWPDRKCAQVAAASRNGRLPELWRRLARPTDRDLWMSSGGEARSNKLAGPPRRPPVVRNSQSGRWRRSRSRGRRDVRSDAGAALRLSWR